MLEGATLSGYQLKDLTVLSIGFSCQTISWIAQGISVLDAGAAEARAAMGSHTASNFLNELENFEGRRTDPGNYCEQRN